MTRVARRKSHTATSVAQLEELEAGRYMSRAHCGRARYPCTCMHACFWQRLWADCRGWMLFHHQVTYIRMYLHKFLLGVVCAGALRNLYVDGYNCDDYNELQALLGFS